MRSGRRRLPGRQRRLQLIQVFAHVPDRGVRELHVDPQALRLCMLLALRLAHAAHVPYSEHNAAVLVGARAVAVCLHNAPCVKRGGEQRAGARTWMRCRRPFSM